MEAAHRKRAIELYEIAIEYGGVFIKLCQFLSARRDIFPEPYINILSPLQDEVPSIAFDELKPALSNTYSDYSTVFRSIEKTPLASASLGQTHRAELNDGTAVVLKILKPGVKRNIDRDFAILFYVFTFLSRFRAVREKVDLLQLLGEFVRVTGDELNFLREIHILNILKKELQKFPFLHIPRVYEELSSRDIIVMEYCSGDNISEIAKWKHRNNDPAIIHNKSLNSDCQMPRRTLVVRKLDRLGRSVKNLIDLVGDLQKRNIQFKSLTDSIDTGTTSGRFFFHVMASLAGWNEN